MLPPLFFAAYNGIRSNNLGDTITLGFLSICIFGGIASLWNTRKSWIELETAIRVSTDVVRRKKLSNIRNMTRSKIVASLLPAGTGLMGLTYAYCTDTQASWFWLLAFGIFNDYATYWNSSLVSFNTRSGKQVCKWPNVWRRKTTDLTWIGCNSQKRYDASPGPSVGDSKTNVDSDER